MTRFDWCAEAEPKLYALRSDLAEGRVSNSEALKRLGKLVGQQRYLNDWQDAQKTCPPGRDPGLFELECFEVAVPHHDIRRRCHGTPSSNQVFIEVAKDLGL